LYSAPKRTVSGFGIINVAVKCIADGTHAIRTFNGLCNLRSLM
jgi:hypothetical protein